jgi:hypothetical protein
LFGFRKNHLIYNGFQSMLTANRNPTISGPNDPSLVRTSHRREEQCNQKVQSTQRKRLNNGLPTKSLILTCPPTQKRSQSAEKVREKVVTHSTQRQDLLSLEGQKATVLSVEKPPVPINFVLKFCLASTTRQQLGAPHVEPVWTRPCFVKLSMSVSAASRFPFPSPGVVSFLSFSTRHACQKKVRSNSGTTGPERRGIQESFCRLRWRCDACHVRTVPVLVLSCYNVQP